jgi:hypothetical protein
MEAMDSHQRVAAPKVQVQFGILQGLKIIYKFSSHESTANIEPISYKPNYPQITAPASQAVAARAEDSQAGISKPSKLKDPPSETSENPIQLGFRRADQRRKLKRYDRYAERTIMKYDEDIAALADLFNDPPADTAKKFKSAANAKSADDASSAADIQAGDNEPPAFKDLPSGNAKGIASQKHQEFHPPRIRPDSPVFRNIPDYHRIYWEDQAGARQTRRNRVIVSRHEKVLPGSEFK